MLKKTFVVLVLIIVFISFTNISNALDTDAYKDINNIGGGFTKAAPLINTIAGIVQVIGALAAVGALIIAGIKFVTSAPEGKAEIKKSLMPFLIGGVLLFSAVGVLEVVKQVTENIFDPTVTQGESYTEVDKAREVVDYIDGEIYAINAEADVNKAQRRSIALGRYINSKEVSKYNNNNYPSVQEAYNRAKDIITALQ